MIKAIKIGIALVVLSAIGYHFKDAIGDIFRGPEKPIAPKNTYISRVDSLINNIEHWPNSSFCKKEYDYVSTTIKIFYETNKLETGGMSNKDQFEILSTKLNDVYVQKFVKQVYYVFDRSEWRIRDISFINKERKRLIKERLFEIGTPIAKDFNKFWVTLNKYYEINSFINLCNNFSFMSDSINASFPISNVTDKIERSRIYLNKGLEDRYVKNCNRLKIKLRGIPKVLFLKHYRFLEGNIKNNIGQYGDYETFASYSTSIISPLRAKLKKLDNYIYKLPEDFYWLYINDLKGIIDNDADKAFDYYLKIIEEENEGYSY